MRVRGISISIEDYLLVGVTNATMEKPDWGMLRAADLERMHDLALSLGENLPGRGLRVTTERILAATTQKLARKCPHLVTRWEAVCQG